MKKYGYTLAEALIAMTIIGVIAAVMLPMMNRFKPDTNKILFLKTYDAIVEITQSIASATDIYPILNGNINFESAPFKNMMRYTDNDDGPHEGPSKYCTLLSYFMGTTIPHACIQDNQFRELPVANERPAFITRNNVHFWVYTFNVNNPGYRTNIYIDLNGRDNGPNCTGEIANELPAGEVCSRPDSFMFAVQADGKVYVNSRLGQEYLRTRNNYRVDPDLDIEDLILEGFEFDFNP